MYTGVVIVGGPSQELSLGGLSMSKIAVGDFNNNAYLLTCTSTGQRLLIDAAADAQALLNWIGPAPLETIVTTHRYRDHWQALEEVQRSTSAQTITTQIDAGLISVETDRFVGPGDLIAVGDQELECLVLRGHTEASLALVYRAEDGQSHIWTGDCLFPGGIGKTESPEDFAELYHAVKRQVFDRFADSTCIYPGHGSDTTLGAERPNLSQWWQRRW